MYKVPTKYVLDYGLFFEIAIAISMELGQDEYGYERNIIVVTMIARIFNRSGN